jgi:hypothetical protein
MHINTYSRFMVSVLLAVFVCAGCSGKNDEETNPVRINPEKNMHELYQRVVKEREKTSARAGEASKEDEALREKHINTADACLKKYTSCLEKCKDNSCEDNCFSALSICEKDLPQNMKTIKER